VKPDANDDMKVANRVEIHQRKGALHDVRGG
jgi:hypothetical protein